METKKAKPVPDVESLRYHGTSEKPDIKIFVSHRIDFDSETIDNPLYIPVRCGAVYDEREGITMLGDDTGDNISEKRKSYCEFTVQYWAWKNIEADYYGLCHYRRYWNFSDTDFAKNPNGNIVETYITEETNERYGQNENTIRNRIKDYDIIVREALDLSQTPEQCKSIREQYGSTPYLHIEDIDLLEETIHQVAPQYDEAARKSLYGNIAYFTAMTIMKKEVFNEWCEFVFGVLGVLEEKIDTSSYSEEGQRTPGHLAERLLGVFITHHYAKQEYKILELQAVMFMNSEREPVIHPAFKENNIAIALASSDAYAPILSVLLQSIKENAKSRNNYDIIVLEKKITKANKKRLLSIVNAPNFSLRFVEISRYLANKCFCGKGHITELTYSRLMLVNILKNYDKVIYLDCDTVVNRDIADLFNVNLEDRYVGAVRDTVMAGRCNCLDMNQKKYNEKELGIKKSGDYFNCGVLLLNLERIRKDYPGRTLVDIAESRKWLWFDQDVLNLKLRVGGGVLYLEQNWNYMAHVYSDERELSEYYAPADLYHEYLSAREEPWIVHFAGGSLPCKQPKADHADLFWKYARNSPYYEQLMLSLIQYQIIHSQTTGDLEDAQNRIYNSARYRIGKAILWAPSKVAAMLRLLKTKGLGYTVKFAFQRAKGQKTDELLAQDSL